LRLPLLW